MAGDMKSMEKMLKPALEKLLNDSGFVKKSELKKLERAILKKISSPQSKTAALYLLLL